MKAGTRLRNQPPRQPQGRARRPGKGRALRQADRLRQRTPDFTEPHKVVNGCSDFLIEVLGDRGKHARSAIGMATLPLGAAVEVEAIVEIA